jgi:hypothetical protein
MKTLNFTTKQKGYGRQGLYFDFDGETYHICDVFPNVEEHFEDYELSEDCFFNEETETYTDLNGHNVTPIDSWDEFLTENYKEEIGKILFESLDFEVYDFDFENATFEEITEWAANY